jgi:hypothetical protein
MRRPVLLLLAPALLYWPLTGASDPIKKPSAEPPVSVPAGASLEKALAAVQRAAGGAVLSEVPHLKRELSDALFDVPLPEALKQLSLSPSASTGCADPGASRSTGAT